MRKWKLMRKQKDREGDSDFWEVVYLIPYNQKDFLLNTYRFRKGVIKSSNYRKCKVESIRCDSEGNLLFKPKWIDATIRKPKKKAKIAPRRLW